MALADSRFKQWACSGCTDKQKRDRNCGNHKEYRETVMNWDYAHYVSPHIKPALKVSFAKTKFYACPLSVITNDTWQILRTVNNCIDSDGNFVRSYESACLKNEPPWLLEAIEIVRDTRAKASRYRMETQQHGKR